jgi:hypothetical protein
LLLGIQTEEHERMAQSQYGGRSDLSDKASDLKDQASDQVKKVADRVEGLASGVAAAVGFVLGALWKS